MNNLEDILTFIYAKRKRNHHSPTVLSHLLALVGNPHTFYKTIYITGTNGKGSTSYVTSSLLMKKGFKVGLYTSPYVITFLERFQVNFNYMAESDFIRLFNQLNPIISEYEQTNDVTLSFFDVLTFIAFCYFKEQQIDYLVLECGIGVMHDSTNVVNPIYSIITSIGLDHKDKLGGTLESVAFDKSHIIKTGIKTYTYCDIFNIFKTRANNVGGILKLVDSPTDIIYEESKTYFKCLGYNFNTTLLGYYQPYNLTLAISAFLDHFDLTYEEIISSINLNIPCRFERIDNYILDGAHNTHGIKALVKSLEFYKIKDLFICFSALDDKDYLEMIDLLKSYNVVFYLFNDARSILQYPKNYNVYTDIHELLKIKDKTVLFTGSLHFVSFVRGVIVNNT